MSQPIDLLLPEDLPVPETVWTWLADELLHGGVAEIPAGALRLCVPLSRCSFFTLQLPRQPRQKLEQLAAFALEDQLLMPPEAAYCVLLDQHESGHWRVAVLEKPWLEACIAALGPRHIVGLFALADRLPSQTPVNHAKETWMRDEQGLLCYLGVSDAPEWDWTSTPQPENARNLWSPRLAGKTGEHWWQSSPWRWTLLLGMALLISVYGQMVYQLWQGQQQKQALQQEIKTLFYQVLPASTPMLDPVMQVKQKRSGPAGSSGQSVLNQLNQLAPALASLGPPVRISYMAEQGLSLEYPASVANAAAQKLRDQGFSLTVQPEGENQKLLLEAKP